MSKYGRRKQAFFEDGMIMETDRGCDLKRFIRERRTIEGYRGRVWFKPCDNWFNAYMDRVRETAIETMKLESEGKS